MKLLNCILKGSFNMQVLLHVLLLGPMVTTLFALLLIALTLTPAFAQSDERWHEAIQPGPAFRPTVREILADKSISFRVLLQTERFAGASVGFAAATSAQVEAFRVLLKQPDAPRIFDDLAKRGTTAGRLYALCGLYLTDKDTFATECDRMSTTDERVDTQLGCSVESQPVRELLRLDGDNVVRLSDGQTLRDWIRAYKATHPPIRPRGPGEFAESKLFTKERGYAIDIFGGGYPMRFAGRAAEQHVEPKRTSAPNLPPASR